MDSVIIFTIECLLVSWLGSWIGKWTLADSQKHSASMEQRPFIVFFVDSDSPPQPLTHFLNLKTEQDKPVEDFTIYRKKTAIHTFINLHTRSDWRRHFQSKPAQNSCRNVKGSTSYAFVFVATFNFLMSEYILATFCQPCQPTWALNTLFNVTLSQLILPESVEIILWHNVPLFLNPRLLMWQQLFYIYSAVHI